MNTIYVLFIYFFFFSFPLFCQTIFDETSAKIYITEMHIHAWSNHNGANKPASLQWHSWQADSSETTSVLWFTEHDGIYQNFDTIEINVEGSSVDTNNNIIHLGDNKLEGDYYWKCLRNDATNKIIIKNNEMGLYIKANGENSFKELALAYRGDDELIKEVEFVKPLAHHPIIRFQSTAYFPPQFENVEYEILVILAWHKRNTYSQDVLWYKFVPSTEAYSQTKISQDTVLTIIPVQKKEEILLDLYNDAKALTNGGDNTISDIQVKIGAKNKALFGAKIADFKIYSSVQETSSIIEDENNFINLYNSVYPQIQQLLGVEYSPSEVHMNAFLPESSNINIYRGTGFKSHSDWSNQVHQAGGIVSYNHIFGLEWTKQDNNSTQNNRSDSAAMALLLNQAYGADYLEVGYLQRGKVDLERHLNTWDKCTANGLFLYGNGVSDSHGDIWVNDYRLFSTYVWANDNSPASLLASLSQGRCFMARPHYFNGKFYFSIGNAFMGDRTTAENTNIEPFIYITSAQADYKYTLTQILINAYPSNTLQYLYNNEEFDPSNPPKLDLTQACFVRIMVYDKDDNLIIISEPIVFPEYNPNKTNINEASFSVNLFQESDLSNYIEVKTLKQGLFLFDIYDMNGMLIRKLHSRYIYAGNYTFPISIADLPAGSYILKSIGNTQTQSMIFIKN